MTRLIALVRHPAWALAAIALALSAPAQDKPAEQKRLFFDTVQVNLISVDVFVTDRAGSPVTGLQREDFEVFEDGRPVKVTNFFAADPSAPALSPVAVAEAPGEPPSEEPKLPPVEQRLSVVLLADNSGITEAERNLALRNARELLADCLRLPHTQAMVVMLDVRAHVRQTFTSDLQLLSAALDKLEREPADRTAGAINTSMIERAMSRISLPSQFSGQGLGGGEAASRAATSRRKRRSRSCSRFAPARQSRGRGPAPRSSRRPISSARWRACPAARSCSTWATGFLSTPASPCS